MHLNQLFVYILLGIVSGAAGAPVSSDMIASSELTKGITQRSYARGANVESGSDPDIRTIGALSYPTQIVVPVGSHSVMEARSGAIDQDWHKVESDEEWENIDHPGQAPGHPTKSTAGAHPEPPTTGVKLPKQKLSDPDLVSLFSLTWVGIKTTQIGRGSVSVLDELIYQRAVDLVERAVEYKWKLTNHYINRGTPRMYPAAAQTNTVNITDFKFLLKLEYAFRAEGINYCEGRVKGESEDGCVGIVRYGEDKYGKGRISELKNKDGVVVRITAGHAYSDSESD
ncbi:hypothetical protein EV368DRAFT_84672 [Lentinula lateritia]|nr:hypothetical protein EV368DRAFT_84672 [Lentinula lateritia]